MVRQIALFLLSLSLTASMALAQTPATNGVELPPDTARPWYEGTSTHTGTVTTGSGGDGYFEPAVEGDPKWSFQKDLTVTGDCYRVHGEDPGVGFVYVYVFEQGQGNCHHWTKYKVKLIGVPANKLSTNANDWVAVATGYWCAELAQ